MKGIYLLLLGLSMLMVSCDKKAEKKDIVKMTMKIEGMHCTGCEQAVANAVVGQKGAIEIFVRYKDGYAVTRFDRAVLPPENIVKAIEKKGYKVVSTTISEENP